MREYVVLLSVPNLRESDLDWMPNLSSLTEDGDRTTLVPGFPAVTCPVQCNMTTGVPPHRHGVVANGFYWRDSQQCEMWTAWNDRVQAPQIWDMLHNHDPSITSAVWFGLLSKGCGADYVCTPAPRHMPDGSEAVWCYTKPESLYDELLADLGHLPLHHFWGPMASLPSTAWIVDSAIVTAQRFRPNFFFIYLPHLDYAAQRTGPDSPAASAAVDELDSEIGKLVTGFREAYADAEPLWLVASEYVIVPVSHVVYPNRILRDAGLLAVGHDKGAELLDIPSSAAWALADHQHAHVFVRDRDPKIINRVVDCFQHVPGIAEVLAGRHRDQYDLDCERAGDVVLVSEPHSWQAYYWWHDDALAPSFARTVDIHRKPGYDPVELFFDPATRGIPLDATRVKGSHGAPVREPSQQGVLLSSQRGVFVEQPTADLDLAQLICQQFGA